MEHKLLRSKVAGGIRAFYSEQPLFLVELFVADYPTGNAELDRAKALAGHGGPGEQRVLVHIPADVGRSQAGVTTRSEFPPILDSEAEGQMYDFQHGRWGDDVARILSWVEQIYSSVVEPVVAKLSPQTTGVRLALQGSEIVAKPVDSQGRG